LGAGVLSIECFGLWLSGLVFSLNAKGENVAEDLQKFKMPNNREGTEEMTKAVAKGLEGVFSDLGHGIAACLSGVV
jgi:hypothetical protein